MRFSKFLGNSGSDYTISIAKGDIGEAKDTLNIHALHRDSFDTPLDTHRIMQNHPCIVLDDHQNQRRYAVFGHYGKGISDIYDTHSATSVEKTIEFLTTLEPADNSPADVQKRHKDTLARTNDFLERRFGDYDSPQKALEALAKYIDRKFDTNVAVTETDGYGTGISFANGMQRIELHKPVEQKSSPSAAQPLRTQPTSRPPAQR